MKHYAQMRFGGMGIAVRKTLFSAGLLIFFALFPLQLNAQSGSDTVSAVAAYTSSIDGTADIRLIELIQPSLVLEVERAGFPVIAHSDSPPDPKAYFASLLCNVSAEGETIILELVFASEQRPELNAQSTQEGKIDLGFDELITRGVSQILDHVLAVAPEYGGREPVPTDRDERVATALPSDDGTGDEPEMQIAEAEIEEIPFKPWKVSVGAAPFIVVGRVNLYFSLGVLSSLRGGYTFRTRAGDVETGLFFGLNYFAAQGLESSSSNFFLPMGVAVRYGGHFGRRLQAFVTVTGGPALFILKPEDSPQLMKFTGYTGGGAGAAFLLGKRLGLTLEVTYLVFFEQYYPIMGVVPSLYFDVRL